MAENAIRLEGVAPTTSGTLPTNIVTVPSNTYTYGLWEAPGVIAANNFLSLFNPVASGKLIVIQRLTISPYATGAASPTNNMQSFRTTAASVGTLIAASAVNKLDTLIPNSIAEVRINNPTCTTVGVAITAIAPAITAAAVGSSPIITTPPTGDAFIVRPGEGIVSRTAVGVVNQLWNISLVWTEI